MWPSSVATASCSPSGRNATANPSAVSRIDSRDREAADDTASQIFNVLSHETLTSMLLAGLGLKDTLLTGPS